MRCPYCKADNDHVVDSRQSADGFAIRRRRACRSCGRRYTTYERVEGTALRVVKKSGERVEFDRAKLLAGLVRACEKRPVSAEQLERLADTVERQALEAFDREVPSKVLGELIMEELRQLDQVAYVRFASVYREFKDVTQFLGELETMIERSRQSDGRSGDDRVNEPSFEAVDPRGIDEETGGIPRS
ncbi:MAG: transcriptional regulator NrdR [Planctomycetota bacterium]